MRVESIKIPSGFEDVDSEPLKPIISATLTLPWRDGCQLAQMKNSIKICSSYLIQEKQKSYWKFGFMLIKFHSEK